MELSRPYAKKSKQQYSVELSCWGGPSSPGPALECPAEFSGIFSQNSAGIKLRNSVFFCICTEFRKKYGIPHYCGIPRNTEFRIPSIRLSELKLIGSTPIFST